MTEVPKDRTIDALGSVWSSIRDLVATLPTEQWATPTALPGWDVAANVAHIVGTEKMLMGEPTPDASDVGPADHVRNDIGKANEAWVRSLAQATPEELLAEFETVTQARLDALREMPAPEWDEESFTPAGRDTYGRFMQIRVFDSWFHEQDIREAVGRPGHVAGPAVAVTLDEVTSALGYVVGKRVGVPQGESVTFELTGSNGRAIHVSVGERAQVVEALDGPASVTLTMPVLTFTRLCGGRKQADDVRSDIEIAGDEDLAEQILQNLGYTI